MGKHPRVPPLLQVLCWPGSLTGTFSEEPPLLQPLHPKGASTLASPVGPGQREEEIAWATLCFPGDSKDDSDPSKPWESPSKAEGALRVNQSKQLLEECKQSYRISQCSLASGVWLLFILHAWDVEMMGYTDLIGSTFLAWSPYVCCVIFLPRILFFVTIYFLFQLNFWRYWIFIVIFLYIGHLVSVSALGVYSWYLRFTARQTQIGNWTSSLLG